MDEAQINVDVEASLSEISESMRRNTLWGNTNEPNKFTIFRTPHNVSQSKNNLFEPSVISIGPFHCGRNHLRALEEQKWQFLKDFLSRCGHITFDVCIKEMILLEKRTRECYSETFNDFSSSAFVEMMLLDGCFVLEYFLKLKERSDGSNPNFEVAWNFHFIIFDLLLLENQIPFFIVERLYEIGFPQKDTTDFVIYIVHYFGLVLSNNSMDNISYKPVVSISNKPVVSISKPDEIHHLLHLFYHYLVPNPDKPVVLISKLFDCANSTGDISLVIPCATELKHKGLKFTPKSNPNHMLDISFKHGVLEIPKLVITDATKPIFANLIAFEHSKHGKNKLPFTMFVAFLDNLVNTPNDVTILQKCGIVNNCLGSEEEVTKFINQVTEFNSFERDHYLAELYEGVNRYIGSSWHRNRAKLIRDYFSNPWAAISLVAAFILLVLTLVQSFFAVFAYYRPP